MARAIYNFFVEDFLTDHVHRLETPPEAPDDECPICREPYATSSSHWPVSDGEVAVRVDPCKHVFGRSCLETHARGENEYSNTCPTCRETLFLAIREDDISEIQQSMLSMMIQAFENELALRALRTKILQEATDEEVRTLMPKFRETLRNATRHLRSLVDLLNANLGMMRGGVVEGYSALEQRYTDIGRTVDKDWETLMGPGTGEDDGREQENVIDTDPSSQERTNINED